MLGYTPEEWTVLDWRDIVHPQDSIRVAALKAELGPDKPQAVSTHRILRKDGAWVWIEAVYTYVPPQHSDEASILVVLRDVTERSSKRNSSNRRAPAPRRRCRSRAGSWL